LRAALTRKAITAAVVVVEWAAAVVEWAAAAAVEALLHM
jgi:hypothetical protein